MDFLKNKESEEFANLSSSQAKTIAIVDDEPDILELVSLNLKKAGFKTREFQTGETFFAYIQKNEIDLVILDLMLPDSDGFEICKFLKKNEKFASIPVIMLTARGDEMEKVLGLELGADDYITKPFSPRELVARVKVVMRRDEGKLVRKNKVKIGDEVEIDLLKYEVFVSNKKIELTSSEFKILKLISEKIGWVYSREQILEYLGANDKGVLDRTVDVHIKNLREKLGESGKYIKNIRGVGYKLEIN